MSFPPDEPDELPAQIEEQLPQRANTGHNQVPRAARAFRLLPPLGYGAAMPVARNGQLPSRAASQRHHQGRRHSQPLPSIQQAAGQAVRPALCASGRAFV